MIHLSDAEIGPLLAWPRLIDAIASTFRSAPDVPPRHHHGVGQDITLLLMPAWQADGFGGVKIASVVPSNPGRNLATVQGIYVLMEGDSSRPVATMDARKLTLLRTAAASALASRMLSRSDAESMLMVGAGALSPHLIAAHASVRPLKTVRIWNRNPERAKSRAEEFHDAPFQVEPVDDLKHAVSEADIISCATMSEVPLVCSVDVRNGTHVDLVGAYRPDMRESDSALIKRSRLFVDSRDNALTEAGDLLIPFEEGSSSASDVLADFHTMCMEGWYWTRSERDVTVFKSVGHAAEDLAAATLAYSRYTS